MYLTTPLLLLFVCLSYFTQAQRLEWAIEVESTNFRPHYTSCSAITHDTLQDCNYIAGRQNNKAFISKLNAAGTTLWKKTIAGGILWGGITHDSQGNLYAAGTFSTIVDVDPSPNPMDTFFLRSPYYTGVGLGYRYVHIFVMKLDSGGQFVWATMIPEAGGQVNEIVLDNAGDLYVSGSLGTINMVQKIDNQGTLVWRKEFGRTYEARSSWEYEKNMTLDDNFLYISGDYIGSADMNPDPTVQFMLHAKGESDNFLVKLDLNGNFIWATSYGGVSHERANAVAVDTQGNIYTSGSYIKDTLYPAGTFTSLTRGPFYYIRKQSPTGRQLYFITTPAEILSLDASYKGHLYAAGRKINNSSSTNAVIQKWRTDNTLTLVWTHEIPSSYQNSSLDITITPEEDIYAVGYFEGIVDFDPSSANYYLYATGKLSGFILKLAPQTIAIPYLQNLEGIQLYPNPTQDIVRIESKEFLEEGQLELMNINGQLLYQDQWQDNPYNLDLSVFPSGTYFVRITNKDKTATLKLIKE